MKTLISTLILTTGLIIHAQAQDFKLAKTSGTLEIGDLNHVTIVGYDGNEILFSARQEDHGDDRRSKGLRAVSNSGLEDNTGIGLSVVDKGTTIEVRQLKRMNGPDVKISVPKGVAVTYTHTSPYGSDVEISNVEGAVEVSTVHNGVHLNNVTGPLDIKTVHGEVEAVFSADLKSTVRIESVHGPVDVSLPGTTKVSITASSEHGEILVDPNLKLEVDRSGGMIKYNAGVTGKINGGGTEVRLKAGHNNVYIRKK